MYHTIKHSIRRMVNPMTIDANVKQAVDYIKTANQVTAFTGAGISKESGISTYREPQEGEWAKHDPMMLATTLGFTLNPKLVWRWNMHRYDKMRNSQPNPAHLALTKLRTIKPSFKIITQNIDDLHERAGSTDITHLHGSMLAFKCAGNCQGVPTHVDLDAMGYTYSEDDFPPHCPHCDNYYVRPNIVWFGEQLPVKAVQEMRIFINVTDVLLVVGLSGAITYGAPNLVKQNGGKIIEVNPTRSDITDLADIWIQAPAGEALPQIINLLKDDTT